MLNFRFRCARHTRPHANEPCAFEAKGKRGKAKISRALSASDFESWAQTVFSAYRYGGTLGRTWSSVKPHQASGEGSFRSDAQVRQRLRKGQSSMMYSWGTSFGQQGS
jgi:hypothetical protein